MSFIQEHAFLIAVAIPVLAVVGLNLFLALSGERETLLLPFARPYPAVEPVASVDETPAMVATMAAVEPANDEHVRKAA